MFALAAIGCSSARIAGETAPRSAAAAQAESDSAAIARARADSIRHPYTEADVRFMSSMIGHHAQALEIAAWAPTHGASRSVQTLAARITSAQKDEIATMQQWLRDRQQPVPEARQAGMMTHPSTGAAHSHAEHEMLMPGMLTEAQLTQLDGARGAEFDRLFLTFMIQHHRGAVSMVTQLFSSYGAGQDETVFKFASDVNVDQITEIERMERMLIDLMFESPSP
ncbi:MAG TPA: DUF305 domain-containing protein [Vicinamibacterales bacterium]|nr:DUF305 domain-containing protein [Vicinamibacterales bacterium]